MQSPTITTVLNGSNRTLFVDFDEAMQGLRANLPKTLAGELMGALFFLYTLKRVQIIELTLLSVLLFIFSNVGLNKCAP